MTEKKRRGRGGNRFAIEAAKRAVAAVDWTGTGTSMDPTWNGDIAAKDEGEAKRVIIVRRAFVDALRADPRVRELFDRWASQSGAGDAALRCALSDFDDLLRSFKDLLRCLSHARGRLDNPKPWPFVKEVLGLSRPLDTGTNAWLWLAFDLIHEFTCEMLSFATNLKWTRGVGDVSPAYRPAVRAEFRFLPRAGESTEAAVRRFREEADAYSLLIGPSRAAPKGRAPKGSEHLEDWARWFYRRQVKVPPDPWLQIAEGEHDRRKAVKDGVAEAQRLLELIRI